MSQQREMIVANEDAVPQGRGWKLEHTSGDYRLSELYFIWVREPVPDLNECLYFIHNESSPADFDKVPPGFASMKPWEFVNGSTNAAGQAVSWWRRPLRRIEPEMLELPPSISDVEDLDEGYVAVWRDGVRHEFDGARYMSSSDGERGFQTHATPDDIATYLKARYAQLNGGAK